MGQQIAIKLAEQGCSKIFCADLNEKSLQKTKELVEGKSTAARVALHVADVSQDAAVREMVEACVKTFGRLDFAANNAGIGLGGTRTHETDVALLERLYKVNEKGASQSPMKEYESNTDERLNRSFFARNMKCNKC
jgi:NAD(P)-dependent dehydrogenase (short-subunit alcohol dehydrogenase family)